MATKTKSVASATKRTSLKDSPIAKEIVDKNKKRKIDENYSIALTKMEKDANITLEYWKELTPDFAQALLENTPPTQRRLRPTRVDQYAADMLAGRWRVTAQPILLTPNLELMDGQHRCAACVKASKVLTDVVVAIVHDPKAYEGVDQAAARSLGDARRFAGLPGADTRILSGIVFAHLNCKPMTVSLAQRQEIINQFPWLNEVKMVCNSNVHTSGMVAALIHCMKVSKEEAMQFFEAVFANKPMLNGEYCDMARLLSTWIYTVKSDRRMGKSAEQWKRECYVRCVRAWNAYRRGENIKRLIYSPEDELSTPI